VEEDAGKDLIGAAIAAVVGESESQKDRILVALHGHHPRPCPSVPTLATWLREVGFRLDAQGLTHVLWSLQKAGLVAFREHKDGSSGSNLVRIHLTALGLARALEVRQGPVASGTLGSALVPGTSGLVSLGTWPVDREAPTLVLATAARPAQTAKPVISTTKSGHDSPEAGEPGLAQVPGLAGAGTQDRAAATPKSRETSAQPAPVVEPEPAEPAAPPNDPSIAPGIEKFDEEPRAASGQTPQTTLRIASLDGRYPRIYQLMRRETDVMEAARILELNGLKEVAEQAIEKMSFTPLELELVGLLRELGLAEGE